MKTEKTKNKYKDLEELQTIDGFNELRELTSFQYARKHFCDFILFERLSDSIQQINQWLQPLTIDERIDFYEGWKRQNNYCSTVYFESRQQAKNLNTSAPKEIQKILDVSIEFWKNQPEQFEVEQKYIENQIIDLKERRNNLPFEIQEDEDVIEEVQENVAWLYAIGVVQYINDHHKIYSTSTLSKILSRGMSRPQHIKNLSETIRKALDRFAENPTLLKKYENTINSKCQLYKIVRVK